MIRMVCAKCGRLVNGGDECRCRGFARPDAAADLRPKSAAGLPGVFDIPSVEKSRRLVGESKSSVVRAARPATSSMAIPSPAGASRRRGRPKGAKNKAAKVKKGARLANP